MLIIRPQFIALDSAQLGDLARDYMSTDSARRIRAAAFRNHLKDTGSCLLLCWHHFEELLQHDNDDIAADRFRFLRSLDMLAWIPLADGNPGLGSIADILAAEVRAALLAPEAGTVGIRDLVAENLLRFGTGEHALEVYENLWRDLRPYFHRREKQVREIVAVSLSKFVDIRHMSVKELISHEFRTSADSASMISTLRKLLTDDIVAHGDRRIRNAVDVADRFFQEVEEEAMLLRSHPTDGLLQDLIRRGIRPSEIGDESTIGQMLNLVAVRARLKIAARHIGRPWSDVIAAIDAERLPSEVITRAIINFRQDVPERKGSELNDRYLACLSPYADITFIDKRTSENFRRARLKTPSLDKLTRRVEKNRAYTEIDLALR